MPMRNCVKVGRMWNFEAALGSCGSVRVQSSADCWTCTMAVLTQIVGAGGLMLVHRYPLSRYKSLDPLSNMAVSIRGSSGDMAGCGWGVGIRAGLQRSAGKFKSLFLDK